MIMKKLSLILAIALILSALCISVFALGDATSTPLVPWPSDTPDVQPTLTIGSLPNKLVYNVGESIDLTGGSICYNSANSIASLSMKPEMISGFDSSAPCEEQVVTVTYKELTVTFTVKILEGPAHLKGDVDQNGSVDSDDAIYLLFHTLFGEAQYPIFQPANFDGVGGVDSDDAIYLLFHTLFGEAQYPLI